tara:strand:+ start:1015 stop:1479 length:465 start_codon:yes stop_codon:yes gene_type:complete
MKTLIDKLNYIQTNLDVPKAKKNSFGNYKYRSLEDITEALKPHLEKTKCTVTMSDEIVTKNEMNYICATVTIHSSSDESISVQGWARESESKKGMDTAQITGSTSSYARKYAMNGLFAIDDTAQEAVYEIDAQNNKSSNGTLNRNKNSKAKIGG